MIRTECSAGVAQLILDRAEKRNALTVEMLNALIVHAAALGARDDIRCVILCGEGPAFCAGFDLALCKDDDAMLGRMLTGLSAAVRAIRRVPQPVIVAAHAAAIAGGCALLGAGDIVITNRDAKVGYPVVSLGISPAVSAPTLVNLTGVGEARRLLLDPALVSGEEAVRIGLAHRCVDWAEDVVPKAQALAEHLAAKPASAMRATKHWLNEIDGSSDNRAFDAALGASMSRVNSDEERALLARAWAQRA